MSQDRPIRVAIIGGGCSAITVATELVDPKHGGRYDVTLYQQGWRLGGKGASGRGPAGRIEEHGLHLWMGFYENAFRHLRECYEALGRDPATCPIATISDALVPDPFNGVADWSPSGKWLPWMVDLPAFDGMPGEGPLPARRWTVADYLARTLTLLRTLLSAVEVKRGGEPLQGADRPTPGLGTPGAVVDALGRLGRLGRLATLAAVVEAIHLVELVIGTSERQQQNVLLSAHDTIAAAIMQQLRSLTDADDEARRLHEIIDLVLATIKGMIRFRLVTDPRGFDSIDGYDCREWLRLNGASERSVNSAFIRALYDLAFAYQDGDVSKPRVAAGQAMRGALRAFFTYKRAFFWKMQAGMGDVIFAPMYELFVKRGGRVEFFHRLTNMRVAPAADVPLGERPWISALEFDVQAKVKKGARFEPLVTIKGIPSWPAAPDWDQLVNGARMRREGWNFECWWDRRRAATKVLEVEKDFDLVVLGVGGGAVRYVTPELAERSARWARMLENLHTVPTQAFQIWNRVDMAELGWPHPAINLSGFVEPYDTWADMTHLNQVEAWPHPPRSIGYFCSVLHDEPLEAQEDPAYPKRRKQEARDNAIAYLERDAVHLWPRALDEHGRFRWDILLDAEKESGGSPPPRVHPIDSQYWTANVSPSERYSLSLPGTIEHRVSPLDMIFDNMTVCGDWTRCGFEEGCVEAAVMSGLLAAHAVSSLPPLEHIVGYDHP